MSHDVSPNSGSGFANSLDLDGIDADLNDVEIALERLEAETYFNDEITGQPLDDQLLINNPIARRA